MFFIEEDSVCWVSSRDAVLTATPIDEISHYICDKWEFVKSIMDDKNREPEFTIEILDDGLSDEFKKLYSS